MQHRCMYQTPLELQVCSNGRIRPCASASASASVDSTNTARDEGFTFPLQRWRSYYCCNTCMTTTSVVTEPSASAFEPRVGAKHSLHLRSYRPTGHWPINSFSWYRKKKLGKKSAVFVSRFILFVANAQLRALLQYDCYWTLIRAVLWYGTGLEKIRFRAGKQTAAKQVWSRNLYKEMEVTKNIRLRRLQWAGNIMRTKDERVPKKSLKGYAESGLENPEEDE